MQEKRNILGSKIRSYRLQLKMTQDEFCSKLQLDGLKIDRTMISKIESCKRELYDFEILSIAKALNVSIDNLYSYNPKK